MDMAIRTEPVVALQSFGLCFGNRVVLAEIDLDIGAHELTVLMGPMGSGKSTLLRVLTGLAQQSAALKTWGQVHYRGRPLGELGYAEIVSQNARMLTATIFENLASRLPNRSQLTIADQRLAISDHLEQIGLGHLARALSAPAVGLPLIEQRLLAIARQTISVPHLLCVDEPTAGLDDVDADKLLGLLREFAEQRAVLMVCHHQGQAYDYADRVALLAGGRIQEFAPAREFFDHPCSPAAREFIGHGTCNVPDPDVDTANLDEAAPRPPALPQPARAAISAWSGPRGFVWLERGQLAGTPQPGIVDDLQSDLDALKRVGVTRLLTLLEQPLDLDEALRTRGIECAWEPIPDMGAPAFEQALRICETLDRWLAQGQVIAVHCRAGHGRTGTILAAFRIWRGESAVEAIEGVRRLESRWIQSVAQIEFLTGFGSRLRHSSIAGRYAGKPAEPVPTGPHQNHRK